MSLKNRTTRGFAGFDATLDKTVCDKYNNADLTLTMKLGFRQINPAGGANEGTYHDYDDADETARRIIKWTPGSWERWKRNLVNSAQRYWNGKFWLINNFPVLEFEDEDILYRHNIYCKFRLIGENATRGSVHHHVIDVVRLHNSETFFGSDETLFSSVDTEEIEIVRDSSGNPIMQRAHVHEIGHLLGLGHAEVGTTACPVSSDTNADACYGTSDAEMNSVMGLGMDLDISHAYPWRMAIASMINRGTVRTPTENRSTATSFSLSGVSFQSSDWTAKMIRHYPRTASEVATDMQITRRPRR